MIIRMGNADSGIQSLDENFKNFLPESGALIFYYYILVIYG